MPLSDTDPLDGWKSAFLDGRRHPEAPLLADGLTVRPERLDDAASDHEAVMANREWLRRWGGSEWPEDGFTSEQDTEGLRGHPSEHEAGETLGYTIAAGGRVVGSLHVNPLDDLLDEHAAPEDVHRRVAGCETRAGVGTRLAGDPGLLRPSVAAIDPWLQLTWPRLARGARGACPEIEAACRDAGLEHLEPLARGACSRLTAPAPRTPGRPDPDDPHAGGAFRPAGAKMPASPFRSRVPGTS